MLFSLLFSQVGWGCRNIPTASLQRGKILPMCPGYDIKVCDGKVKLEFWEMWHTPSLSLLPV